MVDKTTSYKLIKSLRIYSQNVGRKWSWVVNLLESRKLEFDVIFLQEPPWSTVRYSASLTEKTGDPVRGPPVHPDWWVIYPKEFDPEEDRPRVLAYVHRRLAAGKPKFRTDVVKHRDIMLLTVNSPSGEQINLLNVYSDPDRGDAIRYLDERFGSFPSLVYMGGDFNCPSTMWDPDRTRADNHHAPILAGVAEDFGLEVVFGPERAHTWFPYGNSSRSSSLIDLVFLPKGRRLRSRGRVWG